MRIKMNTDIDHIVGKVQSYKLFENETLGNVYQIFLQEQHMHF